MNRHGMLQPSAAGTQPPATDPRVSMVIIDAERVASGRATSRQYRVAERRSGPSASNAPIPGGGRDIADTSRKSKSP
ncbi:MAG: hypothetical protein E5W98_17025 [Mesorhizobium sp.]|nr:MAG: hypothetical protein E5W87_16220 [Mesorhizobium sp.]TKD44418.1 MAG: hypothetical protein E5W98_17025 [Mesorhizobium sp.]